MPKARPFQYYYYSGAHDWSVRFSKREHEHNRDRAFSCTCMCAYVHARDEFKRERVSNNIAELTRARARAAAPR